ncbi:DUF6348 family protein [Actinoplanes sp. NPDC049596]|uniref:DUF6348 family protein n=1 Tax=Actinoplanes sp. NPDC049596 TaxID=3154625 RepID=UPI00343B465B
MAVDGRADAAVRFAGHPGSSLAARQAIQAWIETCLVTVLEMVEQKGRLATHFRSGDRGGFPGWHAIVGSATGWSVDGSQGKQEWLAEAMPWSALVPVIATGLDRPFLNGVRLLVGQGGDFTECEVRINGQRHEPSEAALAAMNWPRVGTHFRPARRPRPLTVAKRAWSVVAAECAAEHSRGGARRSVHRGGNPDPAKLRPWAPAGSCR